MAPGLWYGLMRRSLLVHIFAIQCLAAPFILAFQDGRILNYLLAHGADASFAGWVLSLCRFMPIIVAAATVLVMPQMAPRRAGMTGILIVVIGCCGLAVVPNEPWLAAVPVWAISGGSALSMSTWMAVLHPLVPEGERAPFFARLRLSWTSCGLLAGLALTAWADFDAEAVERWWPWMFAAVLLLRALLYHHLPETEEARCMPEAQTGGGQRCGGAKRYVLVMWPYLLVQASTAGVVHLLLLVTAQRWPEEIGWAGAMVVTGSLLAFAVATRWRRMHGRALMVTMLATSGVILLLVPSMGLWLLAGAALVIAVLHAWFGIQSSAVLLDGMQAGDRSQWARCHLIAFHGAGGLSYAVFTIIATKADGGAIIIGCLLLLAVVVHVGMVHAVPFVRTLQCIERNEQS